MKFVSTRNHNEKVSFTEALFRGLAPDGGLYRPENNPDLNDFFLSLKKDAGFNEISSELTAKLLAPEISGETAEKIVNDAFTFEPAIHELSPKLKILELFHGPSCAFKDFGASFLASAMNNLLAGQGGKAIIVTATSGDTGSAVAQAFHGKERIEVVILYPSGRVSPLQEKQLTTLGGNVTALEVKGSFDDCQRMAKAAFTDPELSFLPLSSANSINLGRLIPQSFYYVWAWNKLRDSNFTFVVPSGNFGNITAGLYAAAWGLPAKRFIAATNANDVVPEYLKTGKYNPRASVATYSNAMDVGAPSNFERLTDLYFNNVDTFRKNVIAYSVSDEATLETMKNTYKKYNYLCCPHTAVGINAAEQFLAENTKNETALVLSTAHPGKFVETVKKATGQSPQLPPQLALLLNKEKISVPIGNKNEDLRNWLLENKTAD